MSDEKTLELCPFCGGDARYEQDYRFVEKPKNFPKWFVICKRCGVRTPTATIPQVQAIWNNRRDEWLMIYKAESEGI